MRVALAEIWERRREDIVGRVAVLDEVIAALGSGTLTPALREAGASTAHQLTGTAGTFGFHRASDLARLLEHALADDAQLDPSCSASMGETVLALRRELDRPAP